MRTSTPVHAAPTYADWSVWGTYAHLSVDDPHLLGAAREIAHDVLADVDRACSRFRDDSDLSRVNAAPGQWTPVGDTLTTALRVAIDAATATQGLVDPCLGRPLIWLGYDRDLAEVRRSEPGPFQGGPAPSATADAWRRLGLDAGRVRVPEQTCLDLGATAKAWTADLIAGAVHDELGADVLVSLGGDIAVAGRERPWPIAVSEHPDGPVGATITLSAGGLATSSTVVRRWRRGGVEHHHLLDPRTGRSVEGPWRTVTATGPTATAANTASTAAVVLGHDAVAWLAERAVTARLVGHDGTLTYTGDWPADAEETTP